MPYDFSRMHIVVCGGSSGVGLGFGAAVILVAYFVAKFVVYMLTGLLQGLNVDEWPERIGWESLPAWLIVGRWTPADRGAAEGENAEDYLAACEAVTAPRDVAARQKLKAEATVLFRLFMARYS